MYKKF
jgi:hypothetical protein